LPLLTIYEPLKGTPLLWAAIAPKPANKKCSGFFTSSADATNRLLPAIFFLQRHGGAFEVEGYCRCQHLDVCHFFGTGFREHIAVLLRAS
jgi:hypothetical protein